MLDLARARCGNKRVAYRLADARLAAFPAGNYDLIVAHFFLDCFDAPDLDRLAARVRKAACPGAHWLISEFRQPRWAAPILAALYLFFRLTTGLKTSRLVDHRPILERHGFRLLQEETSRRGLLVSELWQRSQ